MYAIVKTGGKQYKVATGDKVNIEKIDVEPGTRIELDAICIIDGDKVEAVPEKAAATKVFAVVLEQFKGEKQLVFKFKKRKNYKKLRGHRQQLTRVQIESVGADKMKEPVGNATSSKADAAEDKTTKIKAKADAAEKVAENIPEAKKTTKSEKPEGGKVDIAEKKTTAKKAAKTEDASEKVAEKKPAAKKAAAKKTDTASADAE